MIKTVSGGYAILDNCIKRRSTGELYEKKM